MIFESGYGHHKRMCLFTLEKLREFGHTCLTYKSIPVNMGKNLGFEGCVADKMINLSFEHMFEIPNGQIYRIELSMRELDAINYCAQQVISKCSYPSDCVKEAESVKDYIMRIKIGNDDSVFDKTVEKPLQRKIRRL